MDQPPHYYDTAVEISDPLLVKLKHKWDAEEALIRDKHIHRQQEIRAQYDRNFDALTQQLNADISTIQKSSDNEVGRVVRQRQTLIDQMMVQAPSSPSSASWWSFLFSWMG